MTLALEVRETMTATARQAVSAVCRRARWIDPAEVTQEVWAAMLDALPGFQADHGAPLGAYLYRAALRAGRSLVWSLGAPAHVPFVARSKRSAAEACSSRVDAATLAFQPSDEPTAEEVTERAERASKLAAIVARKLAKNQNGEAIRAVLFGELEPAEAADAYGLDVRQLYWATANARRMIRADRRVKELV